jgi:predicted transcriptional regulator
MIGNSDRVGKSDSIGKLDLSLKRIRGRREFFDEVLKYIKLNQPVELTKLDAYFQYTTGSSETMIKQALAVLENVGLIESSEIQSGDKIFEVILKAK